MRAEVIAHAGFLTTPQALALSVYSSMSYCAVYTRVTAATYVSQTAQELMRTRPAISLRALTKRYC